MTNRQDDSGALREAARKVIEEAAGLGCDGCVGSDNPLEHALGILDAALSPQGSEPAGVGEPVAWRWSQRMHDSMGGWEEKIEPRKPGAWVKPEDVRNLTPLYATPAPAQQAVTELPFDDDVQDILGRPCFTFIHLANVMRKSGMEIKPSAEAEQAACLHWMLSLYLKHGAGWRDAAQAWLTERKRIDSEANTTAQGASDA